MYLCKPLRISKVFECIQILNYWRYKEPIFSCENVRFLSALPFELSGQTGQRSCDVLTASYIILQDLQSLIPNVINNQTLWSMI